MSSLAGYAIAVAAAAIAGWLVPALAMRALVPSLEVSGAGGENYRGRRVFLGLGLVWAAWSVALLVASTALDAVSALVDGELGSTEMLLFEGPLTLPLYGVPIILTLGAVVFGMVDDVFGTHGDKGFRGHLRALASGRLSTGGLKLLGVGAVSAVYGWHAASGQADALGVSDIPVRLIWWVAATLVIALSANLVNLMDLRPGRALKTYSVLCVVAGTVYVLDAVERFGAFAVRTGMAWSDTDTAVTLACMLVVLLGPVAAVWRFDLGERGMLGDAGSNAMGAIVGYLLAGSLSLEWLAPVAVLLVGINVLSERVSFSKVIDRTPPLRFLDNLGRLAGSEDGGADGSAGVP
ncbi:MAG: hypothetical protein JXA36_01145 [Coriobacteriia bacterium]|nr:hypothetical protein [Coriobacteriia bacterium]